MKVGMNFTRDLPYLDVVISYYFKNREVKCSNCEEWINGKCTKKCKNSNEIRECMIKKSMNHVQESKRRGMAVYTDPNRY
jgi:hypothetical protein